MNDSKALKSGIWYTFGSFIIKAGSFLTTPIFTRLLSMEDVGLYSNYSSWLSIFAILATFDLYNAINLARFDYKNDLDCFISTNLIQGSIITTIIFGFFFSFSSFFLNLFSLSFLELFLLYLYCLFYPALQMYQKKCRIEYRYKASVFISIISFFSSTALSLILVLTLTDKYFGRYFGYTIPIIFINIIIYCYLMFKGKKIKPLRYWKYALVIAFPLIWHTLAANVLTTSDRIMINHFYGESSTALYTLAYSCGSIVQILWISMNSAWSPWQLEKIDSNDYKTINKAIKRYSLFFGFVVFCFLFVSPEVLYLMGGQPYMQALQVIPPIMASYFLNFMYSFYVNIETYHKKQVAIAACTIFAAIVNVALNILLLPIFGYIIAAYTTLAGYAVLLLAHFFSCVLFKKSKNIDNKFIFIFSTCFVIISFVMSFLYEFNAIRYIVIAIIALLFVLAMFIFRKEIFCLIKNKSSNELTSKIKKIFRKEQKI